MAAVADVAGRLVRARERLALEEVDDGLGVRPEVRGLLLAAAAVDDLNSTGTAALPVRERREGYEMTLHVASGALAARPPVVGGDVQEVVRRLAALMLNFAVAQVDEV